MKSGNHISASESSGASACDSLENPHLTQNGYFGSRFVSGARPSHLSQLLADQKRGVMLRKRTARAVAFTQQFQISLRQAYRHIAAGTEPSAVRRKGADGKTYGIPSRPHASPVTQALRRATSALRRADKLSQSPALVPADLDLLADISRVSAEIVSRWRTAA